ncbi:MAG: 1-acyl-sn-glycerol-3-phosphate acyltransferase [Firmicutes bacterium]|nr:1-acyl-sn-glycerol-3-phosphate acyltransferase [Bacillota bacterium]MDH7495553.1 lysophospholipid acyltransferase family protein [Bacillota bacterium]
MIVRAILRVVLKIAFQTRVDGDDNVPSEGPVILVANHLSMLDPIVLGCAIARPVRFMAKHELFSNRFFAWILSSLGAFPVRRGQADKEAFHRAVEILLKGQVLGVFPEGTRSLTGRLQAPYSGAVVLAEKVGAPIVPVGIVGTDKILRKGAVLPRPGRISVRVGKPIFPPSCCQGQGREAGRESVDLKSLMMQHIAELIAGGAQAAR